MKFPFIMDDGEHLDDLGVSMPPHEFYGRMRKSEEPQTAQIPYVTVLESFERAAQSGVPTVFLLFSSGLSGTYETVTRVLDETREKYPEAELYVVDTLLASAAEGLLVLEAIRQLDRGLSAQEMVAWAEEARYYVHGYFTLPDLEALRRGGRIPNMAAIAGAKLDIKPILTIDLSGRLAFHSAARGRKKAIKQLLQIYSDKAACEGGETVLVASADANKEQKALEEQVLKLSKAPVIWSSSIGPVIGSHVGPDMLALVFWGPDRRQEVSLTDRIANAIRK
jgi:DegV family protein with EDD domain